MDNKMTQYKIILRNKSLEIDETCFASSFEQFCRYYRNFIEDKNMSIISVDKIENNITETYIKK